VSERWEKGMEKGLGIRIIRYLYQDGSGMEGNPQMLH